MPFYSLIEGEGVAGPLHAVAAETTTLLSCMGIVFFNADTGFAGLYHYPAQRLCDALTQNTIVQMINDLDPTHIYVTAAPLACSSNTFVGSSQEDSNLMDLFLIKHAHASERQWMAAGRRASYAPAWSGGLVLNGLAPGRAVRRSIEMATQSPSPLARTMGGHTMFYGGIGPPRQRPRFYVDDDVLLSSWRTA